MVLCKMCHRAIATTRAGLIRVHGPVHNLCPGSYCSPATPTLTSSASSTSPATTATSSSASSTSHTTSASTAISNSTDNQSSANIGVSGESRPHLIPLVDPLPPRCVSKVIERIPRVCRDRAAVKLASILETDAVSTTMHLGYVSYSFALDACEFMPEVGIDVRCLLPSTSCCLKRGITQIHHLTFPSSGKVEVPLGAL